MENTPLRSRWLQLLQIWRLHIHNVTLRSHHLLENIQISFPDTNNPSGLNFCYSTFGTKFQHFLKTAPTGCTGHVYIPKCKELLLWLTDHFQHHGVELLHQMSCVPGADSNWKFAKCPGSMNVCVLLFHVVCK